eukprot:jgi/Bigna1/71475/fgenesh1_pg.15_\
MLIILDYSALCPAYGDHVKDLQLKETTLSPQRRKGGVARSLLLGPDLCRFGEYKAKWRYGSGQDGRASHTFLRSSSPVTSSCFGGVRNLYFDLTKWHPMEAGNKISASDAEKLVRLERNRRYVVKHYLSLMRNSSNENSNNSTRPIGSLNINSSHSLESEATTQHRTWLRRISRMLRLNTTSLDSMWTSGYGWQKFSPLIEAAGNKAYNTRFTGGGVGTQQNSCSIFGQSVSESRRDNLLSCSIQDLKQKYQKIYGAWSHSNDRYYLAAKIRAQQQQQHKQEEEKEEEHQLPFNRDNNNSTTAKISPQQIWRQGKGTQDTRKGGLLFRTNDGRNLYIANRSGYKGVRMPRKIPKRGPMHFEATLSYLNREIHLGRFLTKEDAARAYDRANLKATCYCSLQKFKYFLFEKKDAICGPENEPTFSPKDRKLKKLMIAKKLVAVSIKVQGKGCGILLGKHRLSRIIGSSNYREGLEYLKQNKAVEIARGGVYVKSYFGTLAKLHDKILQDIQSASVERHVG